MASHGVFLGLCGFEYHGPRGHIGFAPRIASDDFRAAFTAAEGWGTISQSRTNDGQTAGVAVKWGRLTVKTIGLEAAEGGRMENMTVAVGGRQLKAEAVLDRRRVPVTLSEPVVIEENESLEVTWTA